MYIIPFVFILFEIIFFINIPDLLRNNALEEYYKKINEPKKFNNQYFVNIIGVYLLSMYLYFIVSLFYPFWFIGLFVILLLLVETAINKIFKRDTSTECFIDSDKIKDEKYKRKLKLKTISGEFKKQRIKKMVSGYVHAIIRLSTYISIIVLHYNYNLI